MKTSRAGIELIKKHEGFRPTVYKDPIGLDTIGYGTLIDSSAEAWLMSAVLSEQEAEDLLKSDLERFEDSLNSILTIQTNQNQFDAFMSLIYNIGPGAFSNSTALRLHNEGASITDVQEQIKRWNRAGGQVLPGLVKRRDEEAALYGRSPLATPKHLAGLFLAFGLILIGLYVFQNS